MQVDFIPADHESAIRRFLAECGAEHIWEAGLRALIANVSTHRVVPKTMLTIEEAAESTSLGRTKFFELASDGLIDSVLVGRSRRVRMRDLQAFVDGLVPSLPEPTERHFAAAMGRRQQSRQMAVAGRSP